MGEQLPPRSSRWRWSGSTPRAASSQTSPEQSTEPGASAYYNVLTTGRYYRGLRRVTLAGRAQAGFITAEHDPPLPFGKRYFLGGADTLRG
jgi:outer membrane protein assembly factor BamA